MIHHIHSHPPVFTKTFLSNPPPAERHRLQVLGVFQAPKLFLSAGAEEGLRTQQRSREDHDVVETGTKSFLLFLEVQKW